MQVTEPRKGGRVGRAARGVWSFVDPALKAGRIPYTRTMLGMLVVAAFIFIGYSLVKKEVKLPFEKKPYYVTVVMPDARGLNPAKEPAVGVAGVKAGKVVGAKVENGQAVLKLRLDADMKGKIFRNASAFTRPTSILQTLLVNISPGDPRAGALPSDRPIPASRTGTFVSIDQLTGILDPGTQAQVQVLLREAAKALDGREPEVRQIFTKLGRVTDGATPLARALAERRKLLSSLTTNLDTLTNEVGSRGRQLARAVALGNRTLGVTAKRSPEITSAIRELAPMLRQAQTTLASSRQLSTTLVPALEALDPVADKLAPTADKLRDLAPELSRFVQQGKALIRVGATPVHQLAGGLKGQGGRVRKDQIPALKDLAHLSELLYQYRNGVVQTAVNISGAASTARNAGIAGQIKVVGLETTPGGFGLTSARATQRVGGTTRLGRLLAKALEYTCRDDKSPEACALRFGLPGLPAKALLTPKNGG